ncbi:MAG: PEP-CTERM sorting domain-containing protein [Vicinamibacterales bacterium]
MGKRAVVLGMALLFLALHPSRAAADPVTVSGILSGVSAGALIQPELELSFPDFRISVVIGSRLAPGFSISGQDGTAVPFTQTTGEFAGHSSDLDADVTGMLSFVGPTEFVNFPPGSRNQLLNAAVQLTGFLRITQGNHVLFDGTLNGSGSAYVSYEDRFGRGDRRLEGYFYQFEAVAATPEPASLLLVGSGLGWVLNRRRTRTLDRAAS